MFRRKKKEEAVEPTFEPQAPVEEAGSTPAEEAAAGAAASGESAAVEAEVAAEPVAAAAETEASVASPITKGRGHRVQKVGTVSSDKMQKTVVVRVDRLVLHSKYRRYVRRTSKFMAHDDLGATTGDRVRIVETRPQSAKKRWRVVEIVQKAAK
jgi:small subunit ribosomal protein S17